MASKLEMLTRQYRKETDRRKKDLIRFQLQGEVTTVLASSVDRFSDILADIVETVAVLMEAERVSLMVRKKRFLEVAASVGIPQERLDKGILIRFGQGIAGKVAETGEPVITGDLRRDEEFKEQAVGGSQYKSHAFICLPLEDDEEKVVGVINVSNPTHGNTFKKSDYKFLLKVAAAMGMMLHKSMQFEAMRQKSGTRGRVSLTSIGKAKSTKSKPPPPKPPKKAARRKTPRPKRKPFKMDDMKEKPKPPPLPKIPDKDGD